MSKLAEPENPIHRLTPEQLEELGREFDELHEQVKEDLGERDAKYIRSIIELHRRLGLVGRTELLAASFWPAWILGTATLSAAKILENMELGHNIIHGQWDWMNDPEVHSTSWEWDTTCPSSQWKHSHNFVHHKYTNVMGKDNDVGYGILRVTPDQKWHPINAGQPVYYALLTSLFQWGVALHDLDLEKIRKREKDLSIVRAQLGEIGRKVRRQVGKDYVVFPLLTGSAWKSTMAANATANLMRNVWSNAIIFCGHFPDQTYTFTEEETADESRGGWYVRQLTGAANIEGGPLFHVMSGNLGYQVEHHLYPDMPSSRYGQIAPKVRKICEKWGLPYNTGPLRKQWGTVQRTILRLAFPGGRERPKPGAWKEPERQPEPHPRRNGDVDRSTAEGALTPFP